MHSGDYFMSLPWAHQNSIADFWQSFNMLVRPVRMPLFFLVSGLLSSDSMLSRRPDTERKRLVRPLSLYCMWGVIYQFAIPLDGAAPWLTTSLGGRLGAIMMLAVLSWYLAALAIYYVATRLTLKVPLIVVLAVCAMLSLLATWWEPVMLGHQHKVLRCAIFFVAGVRMKPQILHFVETARPLQIALLAVGYAVGAVTCLWAHTFLLPVDVLAVATGATLCAAAARHLKALAAPANWLANRTLPIYLVHFLALPVLVRAVAVHAAPVLASHSIGLAIPLLAVPVIIAGSLGAHAALVRLRLGWLFDPPGAITLRPAPRSALRYA